MDALTKERRLAINGLITHWISEQDPEGRVLDTFDYFDIDKIDELIDEAIAPAIADAVQCAVSALSTPAEAKRGTDGQILLERKLTCEAINGAIAFGYQNTNPPPSEDHWLAPYWKIGRQQAELEARAAFPSDATQAPEGWKLVPVEPTEEMLGEIDLIEGFTREALTARYKAMLAAAPAAPVGNAADFEQMTLNQKHAASNALRSLATMASLWAAEVRLSQLALRLAAVPDDSERAWRIATMIEHGFKEGAYRHFLDHKDAAPASPAPLAAAGLTEEEIIAIHDKVCALKWPVTARAREDRLAFARALVALSHGDKHGND